MIEYSYAAGEATILGGEINRQYSEDWCKEMSRCKQAAQGFEPYHKWIVISEVNTERSRSVTGLMCGVCFKEMIVSDAHRHRDNFNV